LLGRLDRSGNYLAGQPRLVLLDLINSLDPLSIALYCSLRYTG
jgi:hypothetical protein